jgi:hypothetical protein
MVHAALVTRAVLPVRSRTPAPVYARIESSGLPSSVARHGENRRGLGASSTKKSRRACHCVASLPNATWTCVSSWARVVER